MKLKELIVDLPDIQIHGDCSVEVNGLTFDSRKVQQGDLFFALPGLYMEGSHFIPDAIHRGATAILSEKQIVPDPALKCHIQSKNPRRDMAVVARRFYHYPDSSLKVVGITGTNGKTTTAFLIKHVLQSRGWKCGLIGTVRYEIGDRVLTAPHTTPESCDLYRLLKEMVMAGCRAVVMEVSSHALEQHRAHGLDFDVAVFTNLTRDHLDYHGTFENYFLAKAKLFSEIGKQQKQTSAIINADDDHGRKLLSSINTSVRKIAFSNVDGDLIWRQKGWTDHGMEVEFSYQNQDITICLPLFGLFNIANAAAALGAGVALGGDFKTLAYSLEKAPSVPGRLQSISNQRGIKVFVDYAHTDDALEKALQTLREIPHQRILTVFGCGGDRDKTKRPLMGAVAVRWSHKVFVTSDNPRTEKPESIIQEILHGIDKGADFEVVIDRRQAIRTAIKQANAGDIVLIAGKGHENYQEIFGVRSHFDDCEEALRALEEVCDQ